MLEHELRRWGFEVVLARDGGEAWQILQREDAPRIALLDWVMPVIDGLELTCKVRELGIPAYIIVVTARNDPLGAVEVLGAGADDYLMKPYDPKELRARIQVGMRLLELQGALSARVRELEAAISRRDRAEAALREAEGKFRLLFASSPLPMMAYDKARDRFWEVNEKAVELYGYSREEFLKLQPTDLAAHPGPPGSGNCIGAPVQHRIKSGEVIWVEARCERVELEGRELTLVAVQNITDRRLAEQQMRLQATALDAAASGIIITQPDHRITWVNRAFVALTGYSSEELVGADLELVLKGGQSRDLIAELLNTVDAGGVWQGEIVNRRKDGALYVEEVTIAPVRDEAGKVVNLVGVAQDVTQRKRAEAELAHHQDMLRILMDNIPDCIYFKEADGRYTLINKAQAALLGISEPKDAFGLTDFAFLSPEFARESYLDEQRIVRTGQLQVSKPELVKRPGWSSWVTTTKVPVKEEKGQVTGIVGITRDITQWKEAEEALRRSAESFRLLFSSIPHPILVYDSETLVFLEVNDAAVRLYGYTQEEFSGMKLTDLEASRSSETSAKHRTKDGWVLEVEVGSHIFEFRGRQAVLLFAQDVTERKRLEVELQHAQKLEAVGSLAAGIAHEINTPIQYVGDNIHFLQDSFRSLQAVLNGYETLSQAAASGPVNGELLETVRDAKESADLAYLAEEIPRSIEQSLDGVERVATIVRAMREFAHPGRREKTAADLNHALQTAVVVTRNRLKYVADVETDLGNLPPMLCHIADLNQVFLNLLVNASDAIGEVVKGTGEKGKVTIRTRREGPMAVISITDTGCGIPNEIARRIFEPFFTTKEVGKGTGQGLAVARSIVVEKHGGTLTFESQPGKGTTFTISLPIQQAT
jgi:two-component system NtrC family sensor kinase